MILQRKIFPYTVQTVTHATHDVLTMTFVPDEGTVFEFKPGQFVMLRLFNADETLWKQKAFSICSTPSMRDHLELGIKVTGTFTHRAATLKSGDRVEIAGPYGVFTLDESSDPAVFLAAGIGITPFLPMVRSADETNPTRSMFLLYANKTSEDIAYRSELERIASVHPTIHIVYLLSRSAAGFPHELGHVNEELLTKYTAPFAGKKFYLCGPQGFMDTAKQILLQHDVPLSNIKIERF